MEYEETEPFTCRFCKVASCLLPLKNNQQSELHSRMISWCTNQLDQFIRILVENLVNENMFFSPILFLQCQQCFLSLPVLLRQFGVYLSECAHHSVIKIS